MRVLLISYADESVLNSGAEVRPARIRQAFREEGHELVVLSGSQDAPDRLGRIRRTLAQIRENRPDLCYIESPTYPIMRRADRALIRTIHRMGIPIGYFYRDFYRKLPQEFPKRTSLSGRIKDFGLDVLQKLTDRCLRSCDIVYLPSMEAAYLLPFRDMRALPPAGEDRLVEGRKANKTGIYVGGIVGHYDGTLLLDVFAELHRRDPAYELILVCREEEWETLRHPCRDAAWLHVVHGSGAELRPLYEKASFALVMCSRKYRYNDFAVSVKLFEYLSYGLPQVAIRTGAMARLIEDNRIGFAVEPTAEAFAETIERLTNDPELYGTLQENIRRALRGRHLWVHRVRQIVSELTEKNGGGR